jgi:hypothetical protein
MEMKSKPILNDSNFILSKSEFTKIFEESQIPGPVVPLLEQFQNLVPDEIPASLPPMRSVQYCIDFVPSAVLPKQGSLPNEPNRKCRVTVASR